MAALLNKAKGGLDQITGKKELEKEKKEHEETKSQLAAAKEEVEELKAEAKKLQEQLTQAQLDLSKERNARVNVEQTLQAKIEAEEEAKNAANAETERKRLAGLKLAEMDEAAKKQALADAALCYEAMSGMCTSDIKLAKALCRTSYHQNTVLLQTYASNYGKDLYKEVKRNTGGNIRALLLAAMEGPLVYRTTLLHTALSGLTLDENQLVNVLCPCSNEELVAIKAKYQELFKKDLVEHVTKNTGGELQKIMVALLQATRGTGEVDPAAINADASMLFNAGQNKTLGYDLPPFIQILTQRSPAQLNALNVAYVSVNKKKLDLVGAVRHVFGGIVQKAFMIMLSAQMNPSNYYYNVAVEAMKGIGCDELTLLYVLVTRREIDMPKIKELYEKSGEHKRPLGERVGEELGGDLGKAAQMLIGEYKETK